MADRNTNSMPDPMAMGLPMMASWIEMWMMPVTLTAQMMGMARGAPDADEPEIDAHHAKGQLPVPNAHQREMDHDLFA